LDTGGIEALAGGGGGNRFGGDVAGLLDALGRAS